MQMQCNLYAIKGERCPFISIQVKVNGVKYRAPVFKWGWEDISIQRMMTDIMKCIKRLIVSGEIVEWKEGDECRDVYRNGLSLASKMGWE